MLYISESPGKGLGVFTDRKIERDTLIENCPVLVISARDLEQVAATMLYNYYFCWGKNQEQGAIALGLGSIYNHSFTPNATYIPRLAEGTIEFVAIKKILANDEITINYNGTPNDKTPLWNTDSIHWVD